ncbi:sulfatase-like hydrolase/transferase [bacterium]|nr:sulfatase-like hydrolase/transferase [bacterium]
MMHVSFSQKWLSLALGGALILTACNPWVGSSRRKPPIFIIAVESLGFENASCEEPLSTGEADGIQELCDSALRFTHFYTPSTLSQPSLASLLTGQDVVEHQVYHNGNDGIPVQNVTLPERALLAGYRTAFFSGGPPFLAKSGFQQGYEVFDDGFQSTPEVYTAAENLLQRTFNWVIEQKEPTFVTVFLADLQFPFVRTFTDEKNERERSIVGQKQEVAESLGAFFRQLKKKKLWDSSYILFVGLNGEAPMNRRSFLWRENLFRENVHVPLFIKTPNLKESRSIDFLMSMKNIGQLLRDTLEQSTSMADFIMQKLDEWKEAPPTHLQIRSDWGAWWMNRPPLLSLRTQDYLVIPQKRWQIYHSAVDRNEGTVLFEQQVDREKMRWLKGRIDQSYDVITDPSDAYEFMKAFRTAKMSIASSSIIASLRREISAKEKSHFREMILADDALLTENWSHLQQSDSSLRRFVAERNLQHTVAVTLSGSCERLFVEKPREALLRRCRDPLFLALLDWENHRTDADDTQWEKSFVRQFRSFMSAKQLAYINLYLELNWDIDVFSMLGPSLTELYLHLPEKANLRKRIESYRIPLAMSFPGVDSINF